MKTLFFDTYALIELLKGGKNYEQYKRNIGILCTKLNLMELHYAMLRDYGKENAEEAYQNFLPFAIDMSDDTIKKATSLKLMLRKRELSYVDCIGYVLARKNGFPFLTGDEQFRDLEGVEFVK